MSRLLPYAPSDDWQYLLILDACRFDVFLEVIVDSGIKGKLTEARTGVINTIGWYTTYWNEPVDDVHLVSAQAMPFAKQTNRAADNFRSALRAWDTGVVDPAITLQYFQNSPARYDIGARHVVHFVPPHLPYIGSEGSKFLNGIGGVGYRGTTSVYATVQNYGRETGDWETLRNYYRESLRRALGIIRQHLHLFSGKVVITADHGELIGEGGHYDHNQREWLDVLEHVPWMEVMG